MRAGASEGLASSARCLGSRWNSNIQSHHLTDGQPAAMHHGLSSAAPEPDMWRSTSPCQGSRCCLPFPSKGVRSRGDPKITPARPVFRTR